MNERLKQQQDRERDQRNEANLRRWYSHADTFGPVIGPMVYAQIDRMMANDLERLRAAGAI